MQNRTTKKLLCWLLVFGLVFTSGIFSFAGSAATEPPVNQAGSGAIGGAQSGAASTAPGFSDGVDMYIDSAEVLYEAGTNGAFTAAPAQLKRGLTEEQVQYMYANYRKTLVANPDHSKVDQFRVGQGDMYKLADPNVYYTYLRNFSLTEGRIFNIKARIPVGSFTGIVGGEPGDNPFDPSLIKLWYGTADSLAAGRLNHPLGTAEGAWTMADFSHTGGAAGSISEIEGVSAVIDGGYIALNIRIKFFNMDQDQQNVNNTASGYTTSGNGGASSLVRTTLVNDLRRGGAKMRLYYDGETASRVSMPFELRMRDYQYTTLELDDYLRGNKSSFSEFIEADGTKTIGDGSFGLAGSDRYIRVESLGKTPGILTGTAPYEPLPNGPNDMWVGIVADSQESYDRYMNEIVPMMNTNPQGVIEKFGNKLRLPAVYTNIHTPESAGADAPIHLFNLVAKEENIKYQRAKKVKHQGPWLDPFDVSGSASASNMGCRWAGGPFLDHFQMIQYGRLGAIPQGETFLTANPLFKDKNHYLSFWNVMDPVQGAELTTLDIDDMLEHYIFVFLFTQNPDGRAQGGVRAASYGMDPNRDGLYHTLTESIIGKSYLAKLEPVYLVEYHCTGFPFLIDPCTAPHDPCLEFDLISPRAHKLAEEVTAALTGSGVQPRVLSCDENMDHGDDYDDASPIYSPGFSNHFGAIAQTIEAEGLHAREVLSCMYVAFGSMYDLQTRWDDFLNFKIEYKRRGVVNENTDAKVNPFLFVVSPNADIQWKMPGNTWGTYDTTPPWTWAQPGDAWSADGRVVELRSALTSQILPRVTPDDKTGFFPQYYVLPMNSEDQLDIASAKAALEYLTRVQARVERLTEDTTVNGKLYKAGALVIDMRQGNRDIVNTALNVGAIELSPSPVTLYAECVHSFGVFRGFTVDRIDVANAFSGKTEALNYTVASADAKVVKDWKELPTWYSLNSKLGGSGNTVIVKNNSVAAVKAVIKALKEDQTVSMLTRKAPGFARGDFVMSRSVFDSYKDDFYMEGYAVSSVSNDFLTPLVKPVVQINGSEGENRHSFEALGLVRGTDFIYNTTATATTGRTVLVGFNNTTTANYTGALEGGIGVISVGSGQSVVGPLMGSGYSAITLGSSTEAVLKAEINTNSTITANMGLVEYLTTSYGNTPAIASLPEGAVPLLTSLNDEHIPEADRYKSGANIDSFFRAGWAGVPNDDAPVNSRMKAKFANKTFVAAGTYRGDPEGTPIVLFTPNIFFRGANHFMGQRMLGNAILTLSAGINPINPADGNATTTVYANVRTVDRSEATGKIEYVVSLREAVRVLSLELEFEVDPSVLANAGCEALNGFSAIEGIEWTKLDGDMYRGKVTMTYPSASSYGFTSEASTDILKLAFDAKALGGATLSLTKFLVTGLVEELGQGSYYHVILEADSGTTIVYSKYDLNKDNVVDLIDLGLIQLYYGISNASPAWNVHKAVDVCGDPILAGDCDFNGDGVITILDVMELFANFT